MAWDTWCRMCRMRGVGRMFILSWRKLVVFSGRYGKETKNYPNRVMPQINRIYAEIYALQLYKHT